MKEFGTFDLETDPFKVGRYPKAFAGAFFTGTVNTVFWGGDCLAKIVKKILTFASQVKGGYIVYAHNGGKFDFHFILGEILKHYNSADLKLIAIGSRLVSIKTPVCEFRDSYALIPKPLKAFGNKKDIDIALLEEDKREANKGEIIEYLKQDTAGLFFALKDFEARYGIGLTLASTTFKVLKKEFGMKPIKTNEKYDDNFRPYYFAGRVQFFGLGAFGLKDGKKRYNICDINSAFPWAMLSPHWFGGEYIRGENFPDEYAEQSFYHVICDSNGALPKRAKEGGVDFPVTTQGEFYATGWELLKGLELGLVKNLRIVTSYTPTECADFSSYVNHFYEMKKNAPDPASRDFAKLFLNSAYGKFALNPREFRDVTITPCGELPEKKKIKLPGNRIKLKEWEHSFHDFSRGISFWQLPSNDPEAEIPMKFYNVCTAASITGKVRAFLQDSMHKSKGVLYCDTDSIIAENTDSLRISDELGAWKLEKECDIVYIGGKKLYAAHSSNPSDKKEWKTASKGVRLTVEDLVSVCLGEAKSCTFEAPNYSVFSAPKFTTRTINRDDKRKKRTS